MEQYSFSEVNSLADVYGSSIVSESRKFIPIFSKIYKNVIVQYIMLLICPFVFMAQQPLVVQDLLIVEVSRSHSGTPQSVGLLWKSDQPDPEISTWQHTTITADRQPCHRRDSSPQSLAIERLKTHALDSAATGNGFSYVRNSFKYWLKMADTLSKEAWLCHSTGINKHVHNRNEKSRLTKYTNSLKRLTILTL